MISFNLLDINFINFPAGIWETTRSRSSRQRYFQIYFHCNSCKLTKHYSFVYYLLYDWPRRIRRPLLAPVDWGRGGGGCWRCSMVCWLPIVWLRFSAFFLFLKLVKSLFQPQSFEFKKLSLTEATIFELTEIQDQRFVCFHRVISQNSFVLSLTFLITMPH